MKVQLAHIVNVLCWIFLPGIVSAQWAGSTSMTLDGNNNEGCYVNSGNWSIAWDDNYLYIVKKYGSTNEPAILYFDTDPQFPATWGTNANGSVVGKNDWNITPSLPFRSDLRLYWEYNYAEYNQDDGSGGWSSLVVINSSEYAYNSTFNSDREIRLAWSYFGLSGRPAAFNFIAFCCTRGSLTCSSTATGCIYDQLPSENPTGNCGTTNNCFVNPNIEYYWRCNNTSSSGTHNPFNYKCYTYLGTGGNLGYIPNIYDFTINKSGVTINKSAAWTALGYFALADGTVDFGSNADSLVVTDSLVVMGTARLTMASYSGKAWIKKSFVHRSSDTAFLSDNSAARLIVSGNFRNESLLQSKSTKVDFYEFKSTPVAQQLSGNLDEGDAFFALEVNNSAGIILNPTDSVAVRDSFKFTAGKVVVSDGKFLKFRNGVQITNNGGPTDGKFVEGKLARQLDQNGDSIFHVGKGNVMARCAIHPSATSTDRIYIVHYQDTGHKYNSTASATRVGGSGLDHTSYVEHWMIYCNKTGSEDDAFVSLYWTANTFTSSSASDRDSLRVARWEGDTTHVWHKEGDTPTISNVSQYDGMVKANIATADFGDSVFTLGSNINQNPLPVSMLRFDARRKSAGLAEITWETAMEIHCTGFEIWRSSHHKPAEKLYFVPCASTSNFNGNLYRINDATIDASVYYYFLKQIDFDHAEEWYGPVAIPAEMSGEFKLYPTPCNAGEMLNIQTGGYTIVTIDLLDIQGQIIQRLYPDSPIMPQVSPGIYFIHCATRDHRDIFQKIVVSP